MGGEEHGRDPPVQKEEGWDGPGEEEGGGMVLSPCPCIISRGNPRCRSAASSR